jgi:hypothetical protein
VIADFVRLAHLTSAWTCQSLSFIGKSFVRELDVPRTVSTADDLDRGRLQVMRGPLGAHAVLCFLLFGERRPCFSSGGSLRESAAAPFWYSVSRRIEPSGSC